MCFLDQSVENFVSRYLHARTQTSQRRRDRIMRSVTLALIIAGCGSVDSMPYKPPVVVERVVMTKPAAWGAEAWGSVVPEV